ncbi:hypothetical protein BH10PSE7_BH10PSE7_41510 [soil metagenome]
MREIKSGRPVFGGHEWGIFDMVGQFDPGLIVDVGAAVGHVTSHLLYRSPKSHAIAFEPFPGNWPHLEKTFAGKPATIVRSAVADVPGEMQFALGPLAKSEGVWAEYEGYGPGGYIASKTEVLGEGKTINVPVTTLDDSVSERILFLKIDVQGGELNVLRGAEKCFLRGIDLLYVEFGGEKDILDFLFDRDYLIFDHKYTLMAAVGNPDYSFWDTVSDFKLSTGYPARYAWPKVTPADPGEYCAMFSRQAPLIGHIFTDIVAVRRGLAERMGWAT